MYVSNYIGANVKHFECMSEPMNEALLCTYAWLDFAYYTADTITSLIWRNKFAYASATKLNSQFAGIDTVIRSYAKIQIMYIYTLVQPPVLAHLKFSKIKNEFFFVFFFDFHIYNDTIASIMFISALKHCMHSFIQFVYWNTHTKWNECILYADTTTFNWSHTCTTQHRNSLKLNTEKNSYFVARKFIANIIALHYSVQTNVKQTNDSKEKQKLFDCKLKIIVLFLTHGWAYNMLWFVRPMRIFREL